MKKLLILSGKGGTGKTTMAGALIALSKASVFADCDVDAPNLHLLMPDLPEPQRTDYYGFGKAVIDETVCIRCGLCEKECRFGAIKDLVVDAFACEGCAVCMELCPVQAITMQDHVSGELKLYRDGDKMFSTAQLHMGSGASGKLVTAVKQQMTQAAGESDLAIIDGSPGIGCPVIASITGVDFVLVVTEPTVSGLHDLGRILDTANHFEVPCAVCVNRYDVSPEHTEKIARYCGDRSIPMIGKIPFDATVVEAVNGCRTIADYPESPAGQAILEIWARLRALL